MRCSLSGTDDFACIPMGIEPDLLDRVDAARNAGNCQAEPLGARTLQAMMPCRGTLPGLVENSTRDAANPPFRRRNAVSARLGTTTLVAHLECITIPNLRRVRRWLSGRN